MLNTGITSTYRFGGSNNGLVKRSRRASDMRPPDKNGLEVRDRNYSLILPGSSSPTRRNVTRTQSDSSPSSHSRSNSMRSRKKSSCDVPAQFLSAAAQERRQRGETISTLHVVNKRQTPDWLFTLKPGEVDCPCLLHCRKNLDILQSEEEEERRNSYLRCLSKNKENQAKENKEMRTIGTQTENKKFILGCFPKIFKY